jgi:hypothetical protein
MNRRRRKLIRWDLQLKVVFVALFVACFILLVNFQMTNAGLWRIREKLLGAMAPDVLLEDVWWLVIKKFFLCVCLVVPLAASVGVLYSFTFCGPIHKFKKYLLSLAAGRWDDRCGLRTGDDLKDVCEAINEAVDTFRDRIVSNHEILEDVGAFLEEVMPNAHGQTLERMKALKERIDSEAGVFAERLGAQAQVDEGAEVQEADKNLQPA